MSPTEITVPSVGESITEGTLARWLKADGSLVEQGDPLFELETDKASSVVAAPAAGMLKIGVAEGQTVAIGAAVGTIDPNGAPGPSAAPAKAARGSEDRRAERDPSSPVAAPVSGRGDSGLPLSPAVRRLVAEEEVDVAGVTASGPGGRITKGDVLAFLETPRPGLSQIAGPLPGAAPAGDATQPPPAIRPLASASARTSAAAPRETRKRMSGLRQRIAQRLVEAQQTAAILTTFNEADMSRVLELRSRYKEPFQSRHGVALGFMSFFVKAAIEGLKAFPAVNARIEGNEIVYQNFYDVGVAVSTERGLVVPIVRDADRLSFAAIEKTIGEFANKARDGMITVDDLQGGTFTITNGGVFGSLLSTPILNPPQSGILGMHAIKKRPAVVDDQIVARPMMYLALSYDHRLIDGREAVGFLIRVKDGIENPERMMFEI
ncbi:MAG: 2-oxoglutarate dehydrogenase complex dihydrolipoyllysine-residue succinyltransferase [Isosphaeraceae bacterium]